MTTPEADAVPNQGRLRYSIPQAAEALSIGESTVRLRISQGHLRTVKDGNRTFIHRDEIDRYAREGTRR